MSIDFTTKFRRLYLNLITLALSEIKGINNTMAASCLVNGVPTTYATNSLSTYTRGHIYSCHAETSAILSFFRGNVKLSGSGKWCFKRPPPKYDASKYRYICYKC